MEIYPRGSSAGPFKISNKRAGRVKKLTDPLYNTATNFRADNWLRDLLFIYGTRNYLMLALQQKIHKKIASIIDDNEVKKREIKYFWIPDIYFIYPEELFNGYLISHFECKTFFQTLFMLIF